MSLKPLLLIFLILLGSTLPFIVWWIIDRNPKRSDKKGFFLIVSISDLIILIIVGLISKDFIGGLMCGFFGIVSLFILYGFLYLLGQNYMSARDDFYRNLYNQVLRKDLNKYEKSDDRKKD